MYPETLSQSIIKLLTDAYDPEKKGAAIEIGVGTDNFYSVKYKEQGLKCVAVDPIAYAPFLQIACEKQIHFEEACIFDKEGEITLFSNNASDLSSINHDWWGVDTNNYRKVKAILLTTLIEKYSINKITFLKADTEGSEYEIIKQLKQLSTEHLPAVVEFEYGGGGLCMDGIAGWDIKFVDKVLAIVKTLQELKYEQGLIIDSNDVEPIFVDLTTLTDALKLFKPHYEYGNFLVFKKRLPDITACENTLLKAQAIEMKALVNNLYYENNKLNIKILKSQYFKRAVNRIKRVFKTQKG